MASVGLRSGPGRGHAAPLVDLGEQAPLERRDGHVTLDLVAARVHADGLVGHVVVADDQHVGQLLSLGATDAVGPKASI